MQNYIEIFNLNYIYAITSVIFIFLLYYETKISFTLKKFFIVVSVLYNLIYLIWRAIFTLPLDYGFLSISLGIVLLLAELMGFWQSMTMRFIFWKPYKSKKQIAIDYKNAPRVDVFIATYNEGMEILRKTIAGCQNLNYPKDKLNIYLCDDGKRKEAFDLSNKMGINYITRENNEHAKAGNINNAMKTTKGELIMLLDADMVPKSAFLERTVGYFLNKKVGFVQTPQVFYNPDPFQHNLKFQEDIPNEQDFFMFEIQARRSNFNAVLHVGTNAIFQRCAINDIGGIPTGTITEDMATGMLIQSKGYESVFIKEILCTGLSVESFADLVRQRERWCRGNIQVSKKWNPLKIKGLTLAQRLIYLDGLIYWFFGVQKMIYIICPLLYLIFGVVILDIEAIALLTFWLPSFLSSALIFRVLVPERRTLTWSHIYEVAMAPFMSVAAIAEAVFSRPVPFRVTPKGENNEKSSFSARVAIPHIVLLLLTVLGIVITGARLFNQNLETINSDLINLFWAFYNFFAIIMAILVCFERPRKRYAERIRANETITATVGGAKNCEIIDISETGIKLSCDLADETIFENEDLRAEKVGTDFCVRTKLFDPSYGKVVWSKKEGNKHVYGIKLNIDSDENYRKIVKYISDKNTGYYHSNRISSQSKKKRST